MRSGSNNFGVGAGLRVTYDWVACELYWAKGEKYWGYK